MERSLAALSNNRDTTDRTPLLALISVAGLAAAAAAVEEEAEEAEAPALLVVVMVPTSRSSAHVVEASLPSVPLLTVLLALYRRRCCTGLRLRWPRFVRGCLGTAAGAGASWSSPRLVTLPDAAGGRREGGGGDAISMMCTLFVF